MSEQEQDDEIPADEAGVAPQSSDYNLWLQSTIFDFLSIADLPTSNERHKALVALRLGEKLSDKFKLIEAYLLVESVYAEAGKVDTVLEFVAACRAKVIILKKQLGI